MTIARVILLVLDSVGVGATTDAADYGDAGANTLGNIARHIDGLRLPNLERLGLGNVTSIEGVSQLQMSQAAFGRMKPRSPGKETTTGHWELAGVHLDEPFACFPQGFPPEIIESFENSTGIGVLGNRAAPEHEMLDTYGEAHMESRQWIVFTSASSVFQVAAHEKVIPAEELYAGCRIARRILDPYRVGRVIAHPFKGARSGEFQTIGQRREFPLLPPEPTVLDRLSERGVPVVAVGRVSDIFAGRGISERIPTNGNTDGMIKLIEAMSRLDHGLVVAHLDDFDTRYGHRRDPEGYARCLEELDVQLAMLMSRARDDDLLLISADHGNDPTRDGSDHSRELVPILAVGPASAAGVDLGTRESFADVAATIGDIFGLEPSTFGESFLKDIS